MGAGKATLGAVLKAVGFVGRQQRDWKTTLVRSSLHRFVYQMVFPYMSIYTVALGATATQLGIVNTTGMLVAAVFSLLTGWLIDRTGVKTIYLIAIGLLTLSYLTYGVAQGWVIIIISMAAWRLGDSTSMHGCSVICGNSLASEDRVTGMSICEGLAAGLMGMAGPMLGALLVAVFGGVNVEGIRPLFFVALAITIGTFFLVTTQLSNHRWGYQFGSRPTFFKGFSQVFKEGHNLKRWLIIGSITSLPLGMILPFTQPFAHEVKGADQYVLGAMVTGFALTPLVFGIPLGRLADKIGRKRVLYLIAPLFWVSNLMLIWAPGPVFLIVAGVLQGFFHPCAVIVGAMTFELVPPEKMGRWIGINRFFRMSLAAGSAFMSGVIWDTIGPQYVFLAIIGLDVLIRIPLLIGMPETLGTRMRTGR
ncbi:MFS transporter [Chloroflexota bacterium]